jgi:hypothetical protein
MCTKKSQGDERIVRNETSRNNSPEFLQNSRWFHQDIPIPMSLSLWRNTNIDKSNIWNFLKHYKINLNLIIYEITQLASSNH